MSLTTMALVMTTIVATGLLFLSFVHFAEYRKGLKNTRSGNWYRRGYRSKKKSAIMLACCSAALYVLVAAILLLQST